MARIVRAARCSRNGLGWLLRNEAAFRQEVALFSLLLLLGHWCAFDAAEQFLQISMMALILSIEALNTAIERVVDRIGTERHALSGLIKDISSAAVLLSMLPLALFWFYALVIYR